MLRSPTRLKFKDCTTAQKLSVGSSRGHQLLPPKSEMLQTVNMLICGGWSGCLQPSVSQLFLPVCKTKVGCWLQLAMLDWYLSHRHRAAQVVDQVVYQTSIRREWADPPVHVSKYPCARCWISICPWYTSECVCVTKDWFVYHDHHPQYNPVSPVTPDFIFYLFVFWNNF